MSKRKGEMSKSAIDRGWPHQVALHEDQVKGANYWVIHDFIRIEGLSNCPRGHTFQRDGAWFNVFCFAEPRDAEVFHLRFGGEMMDPKERPPWPGVPRGRS